MKSWASKSLMAANKRKVGPSGGVDALSRGGDAPGHAEIGKGAEGCVLAKDALIEAVAYQMSEGKWVPFRSVRAFADKHNVSLLTAQKYAAEATRLLRMSWGQDEAKVAVLERIAYIGRDALERTEEAISPSGEVVTLRKPDHRTAFSCAKSLADYLGLGGTNSEVVVRYQAMSDSELWTETQKFVKQLQGNNHEDIDTTATDSEPAGNAADRAALDRLNSGATRSGR